MNARHLVALLVGVIACSPAETLDAPASPGATTLRIYVVNEPLRSFASRIGGDAVEVHFPAPAEVDPAFWSPDGETVSAYQGADVILLNGAGYAAWVSRATLSSQKLVDTSAAYAERLIPRQATVTHQHGPAGDHSHAGTAFTTWLDPTLAVQQARAVADALSSARPDGEPAFRANLAALETELDALDTRLAAAARRLGDRPLLFSHPVYAYLERRYALNGRSLHWEPDQVLGATAWRELETLQRDHPANLLIWEAEPLAETRAALEARGVTSLVFAPCGNRLRSGDWLDCMQANAGTLETAPIN